MQLPFSKQLITAALIVVLAPAATVIGAQSFSDFISKPQPYVAAQEMMGPPPGGTTSQPPPPPPGSQPGQPPGDVHPPPPPGSQPGIPPGGQPGLPLPGSQPPPPGTQPVLPPSEQPGVSPSGPQGVPPPPSAQQPSSGPHPTDPTARPTGTQGICPAMPVIECPADAQSIFETTPGGCSIQKCIPKGTGDQPRPQPDHCFPPPQNLKCEEAGKYPNGCPKFKCERQEQPRHERSGPPPALENCAREVLGSEALEQMLKGGLQPTEEQKKLIGEKCGQFKREMPKPSGEFPGRGEFRGQPPGGEFPGRGEGLERAPGAGGFGPGGPTMRPGDTEGGFGPSEEDMERMEKEQKARMLKEMQRGLRGMEQGLRMMDRGLNACRKAKIDTADADASLATIKDIVTKVRTATDPEELPDLMSDLPEHFDKLREIVENCNRVAQLPRITKQLSREIKQLEGEHRTLTSQATRAKLDLADQLNGIATGIETIKVMLAEVSRVKTTEEFEDAMAKLEGLHDTFEDLRENMDAVRSVLNVKRAITDAKREIRNAERLLSSLKRKGTNTAALAEMIAEGKVLVAELDALAKQKPVDADALHEKFEQLEDLGGRAEEELAKLRGLKFEDRFQPKFDKSSAAGFELPDSFRQFEKKESEEPSEFESLLGF